ncbi:MAG: hypothetical protein AAB521_04380 [Patescibacteria group bacterium]
MNKNVIIAIVALVLIVLGSGAYIMSKNSAKAPSSQTSPNQSSSGDSISPKSMKDLLTAGQSQKCTFTDKIAEADSQGTVYVANGKMRGDFDSQVSGESYIMHMIVKDNQSYTWTEGQTTGFMMEFNPDKIAEAVPTGSSSQTVDVNKYIDYKCSGWTADESVFTPPANVKFQNFGEVKTPTGSAGESQTAPQNNCAMCNYLSGDAKDKCLAELQCN